MEYIEGMSLSQMVKEHGALSERDAIDYVRKVADAVGYMHSLRMNHLDLKPANIMARNDDNEPILIDFGLSKQYDASGGQTSTTPIGISHGFAPIEQYRPGGVATFTPQTDIYALGATLFNLLSGQVPPHYSEILEDGIPELSASVSRETTSAIEHALEVKKQKRPQSIEDFLHYFDDIASHDSEKENVSDKVRQTISSDQTTSDILTIQKEIESDYKDEEKFVKPNTEETQLIPQKELSDDIISKEIDENESNYSSRPIIKIFKKRGMFNTTRDEYVNVSWEVTDAKAVYLIVNGMRKLTTTKGAYVLTKNNKTIQIHATGYNNEVVQSIASFY